MKFLILLIAILGLTLAGHIPGLRGFYPQEMIQKSGVRSFSGLQMGEFIENSQDIICPENVTQTFTNGSCHNLRFPLFGISNNIEIRFGEANFEDGRSEVDENQVSARLVSNEIADQPNDIDLNLKDMTRLLIFMGQFIDHDFALTLEQGPAEEEGEPEGEELPVEVPEDDPEFDEDEIEFFRSEFVTVDTVREFETINTPWLDLGNVYGDNQNLTDTLRNFTGGLMNTTIIGGREFPPRNEFGLFLCGDIRCEENVQLFSFHTLFLREHNRIARAYVERQLALGIVVSDEEAFQFARLLNINQYQSIIFDFYLPYLIGRRTQEELIGEYEGFVEGVDPTISVAFASAVYRYGHSGIPDELQFTDTDGNNVRGSIALVDAFLNVETVIEGDPEDLPALFVGQSLIAHHILDANVVDALRNNLFANTPDNVNAESGMDLIMRNIQRCRDHGCSDLNTYRYYFGLEPYECEEDDQLQCFLDLTQDQEVAEALAELYETFEECDLWICGMAEALFEDSSLGETFTYMLAEQFGRLRDGDRIYYELLLAQGVYDETFLEELNIRFPARLSDLVGNNLDDDLPGAGTVNSFAMEPVYLAWQGSDVLQVEWVLPDVLRNNIAMTEVTVTLPNGTELEFEFEENPEFDLYVVVSGLEPESEVEFEVMGTRLDNGNEVEIGTRSFITAVEGEVLGGGANVDPALVGGIVGGVVGGIVLIGGVAFCVRRRNRFNNDDINNQFF